jgi:hypothetical protein
MRVLCVQHPTLRNNFHSNEKTVVENEIYNSIHEFDCFGCHWYILKEFGYREAFQAECFIPLSDIDETELIEEKEYTHCV